MKRNRVNVLTVVNSASNITTETVNGKPHIVVRGITPVVDDIVMNRKLYQAAEIENAYNTLERNLMPLGHPKVDGKHVSARDVQAVNEYHVGAWLQNVSHKDGKVTGDMYVNRQYAESSEKGKRLINRLDEMLAGTNSDPIHISTGPLYSGIAANGESKGKKYNEIATNMMFDHVAVLLDEPGAGTPSDDVGIFVNAEGDETEIEVCNLQGAIVIDNRKDGWLNKIKFFVANDGGMSFDEIASSLREANLATLPKVVPAGSTPGSTGGTGEGKWQPVDVSDVLRKDLAKSDGLKLIGRCKSVSDLRSIEPESNLQQISVISHTAGTGYGGGTFESDYSDTTSEDNNGTIVVTSGGMRWKRKFTEIKPEFFGALGDGIKDDTVEIKSSDSIAKELNVRFVASAPIYKISGCIPLRSIPIGGINTIGGIVYIKGEYKNRHISSPITPAVGAGQNANSVFRRHLEFAISNQPTTSTKRPQGLAIDNVNNQVYVSFDTGADKGQVWRYSRNGVVDSSFGQVELILKHAAGAAYRYSNNKMYVCSGGSAYGLEVYELSTDGKSISNTIDLSAYGVGGLMAIDNDNDILVTGGNLNGEYWFRFFNFETSELLWSVKDPTSYAVAGNPQGLVVYGGYLFYVTDNGVHIIDFSGVEVDFLSVSIIGEAQGAAILQDLGVVSLALMRESGAGSTPML